MVFWKSRQPKCGLCKDATPNCCENEDYNLIGTICYDGLGRYRDEGKYYCAEDKLDGESLCNAEAIESPLNYEICNSFDDNCNGQIDEGFSIDEKCTGDNGIGGIKCLGDNDTYCKIVITFTPTFTLTNTNTNTITPSFSVTYTPSYTNTLPKTFSSTILKSYTPTNSISSLKIVTPKTILERSNINKNIITLEKFDGASINEHVDTHNADYKYVIHVRKLKRLGVKDNYYKLGKLELVPKSKYLMAEN